jgi:prolyl-tRNA editing enzyme YbaK/EbsC (Cys-tRNA(Pro) deacylase)
MAPPKHRALSVRLAGSDVPHTRAGALEFFRRTGKTVSMKSTERVRAAAEAAGLTLSIHAMPQTTRTAADAAAACGTSVAQIVKSLVFRKAESGEPVLVLVSGANRVDQTAIKAAIGEALTRIDADAVRALTGFAIGGVAPLGSLTPLATFIDADLMRFETVWAAAGAPDAVFEADPKVLAEAAGAKVISVT